MRLKPITAEPAEVTAPLFAAVAMATSVATGQTEYSRQIASTATVVGSSLVPHFEKHNDPLPENGRFGSLT